MKVQELLDELDLEDGEHTVTTEVTIDGRTYHIQLDKVRYDARHDTVVIEADYYEEV